MLVKQLRRTALALLTLVLCLALCGTAGAELGQYTSIKLNKALLTISPLTVGAKLTVTNERAGYEPISWSISPASVADIDADTGVITPKVKNGRAVITARGSGGGAKASCALLIKSVAVTSFTLNAKKVYVAPGRTYRFKASVKPANATYRAVSWTLASQNTPPTAADQSRFDPATGIFTAGNAEGELLTLTAATNGGRTATARILVRSVPVSAVKFTKSSANVLLGNTYDLNKILVVQPSNAADKSVTWTSSDAAIAAIDADGRLTVREGGTVKITATSASHPSKKATCTIRAAYVRVKSIKLSASSVITDGGDSYQCTATVSPANAAYKDITWTSSNESVATVSGSGKITAKGPGVAAIVATAAKDGVKAKITCRVRGGNMKIIKLSAIGDVVLGGDKRRVPKADDPIGDRKTSYARFKALYDAHGPGYFLQKVAGVFAADSVTIANVEGVLTNATAHASKSVLLAGPPKYREVLALGGVDMASIANNHAYDFLEQGHRDTVANLRAAGLKVVGQGSGSVATTTVDGVRMGFAAFQTPANRADVQRAVRNLKVSKKCSIVVVSFHWAASPEWTSSVYTSERSLARFAVNCGADLVLGHHKHLVSGIERYKGKMIAYDLGNFVSMIRHVTESGSYVTKDSMIYQQRFHVFEDGYVEVTSPNILSVMNSATLETFTGQPRVVSGTDAARILDKIRAKTPSSSQSLVRTIPGY